MLVVHPVQPTLLCSLELLDEAQKVIKECGCSCVFLPPELLATPRSWAVISGSDSFVENKVE